MGSIRATLTTRKAAAAAWRGSLMRQAATLVLCAGVLATPALAAPNAESQRYFNEARTYMEQGETAAAIIQLKNAIRADPDNVQARLDLARLYLATADAASAEKELKSARDRGLEPSQIAIPLAQAYLLHRKFEEVVAEIQPDLFVGSERALVHVARADAYNALGNKDAAIGEAEAAIAADGQLPEARLSYAVLLQGQGKLAEAEAEVDTALALAPGNPNILYQKGDILRVKGDAEGAIELFRQAIEINPRDTRARIGRSLALISLNRLDEADGEVAAVFEFDPDNAFAKYARAVIQYRENKPEQALDTLISARGIDALPAAQLLFATLYFYQDQVETARDYIERFLRDDSDNTSANLVYAAILGRQGEFQSAIQRLEPLYEKDPDNYQVVSLLANAYLAVNELEKAAPLFDRALSLDPDNQQLLLRFVETSVSAGNPEPAVSALADRAAENPDDVSANALLVLVYMRTGELEKARVAAQQIKSNIADNGLPYNLTAAIYLAEQDFDNARAELEQALSVDEDFYPAYINLARLDRQQGRMQDAADRYRTVLQRNEGLLEAQLELAEVMRDLGDLDGALAVLGDAIEANPEAPQPLALEVDLLIRQGRTEQALIRAREFDQRLPRNPVIVEALAKAQAANDQLANAAATYRILATLRPNAAAVQQRLGNIESNLGNVDEAAAAYDRAIEINPSSVPYRLQRLVLEQRRRGLPAAEALAANFAETFDEPWQADLLYADLYFNTGEPEKAEAYYQSAYEKSPSQPVLLQHARTLSQLGRHGDAEQVLSAWLTENPEDGAVRFALGGAKLSQGDFAAATREYERLLESTPENALALNNLAWLYEQAGDRAKAIEFAERAYALQPALPEIADTIGWLYHLDGQKEKAIDLLRKAYEGRSGNAEIGYHLAAALNADGQRDEARTVLEQALSGDQVFAERGDAERLLQELKG